jgi:hypothetical protein
MSFDFEVPQAWQRRDQQEPGNLEVERAQGPVSWVIWRPKFTSHFRSMEPDEAAMMAALMAGRPFPELCEVLLPYLAEDQVAARAAGLLRAWVEEGMIASFSR